MYALKARQQYRSFRLLFLGLLSCDELSVIFRVLSTSMLAQNNKKESFLLDLGLNSSLHQFAFIHRKQKYTKNPHWCAMPIKEADCDARLIPGCLFSYTIFIYYILCYLSWWCDNFKEIIIPNPRDEWCNHTYKFFRQSFYSLFNANNHWFPRTYHQQESLHLRTIP